MYVKLLMRCLAHNKCYKPGYCHYNSVPLNFLELKFSLFYEIMLI